MSPIQARSIFQYPMRKIIAACFIAAMALITLGASPRALCAQADDAVPTAAPSRTAKALLIPIEMPLRGQADELAKQWLSQAAESFPKDAKERPTIVLEFRAKDDGAGQGGTFERALSLARFLISRELSGVRVVAYVPRSLKGHSILPVLACEQVILAKDASLSDAGIDETQISETLINGYREIADARRTFPAAVAIGLLDKSSTVSRIVTSDGVKYVLADELKEIETREAVNIRATVLEGDERTLGANALRNEYGFVSHLASNRAELASALNISPDELEEDPSLVRPWKAMRIKLDGPLNQRAARWTRDQIELATGRQQVNFVCLEIDSSGGDIQAALLLAEVLAKFNPAEIRTIAYVNNQALGDAALVALACDQIVMAPSATLGGSGALTMNAQLVQDEQARIKTVWAEKGRDWSLPLAMIDSSLEVNVYKSAAGAGVRFWTEAEHANQPDSESWLKGELVSIDRDNGLPAEEAVRLGVARAIVESSSEIEQIYHLPEPMTAHNLGWAHELVQRLADPRLAGILLFIAFSALIIEAMTPGIGLPAMVSGVCFMLFFWSQFLHGTAGWLEVMLFVVGVSCIAVELFIIPGFGVFGLGGIIMVISSIILASQTFVIPTNAYQLKQLPNSLYMVTGALAGTATCAFLMRKYLSNAPIIRRMILDKAPPEEIDRRRQRESFAAYDFLLNKRGAVVTPLTPAGKARFGDDLIDVVSADGDYVERGADIYVVEVLGSRVAVRKIT